MDKRKRAELLSQLLVFLGIVATEIVVSMERGEWQVDHLPSIVLAATLGYLRQRKGDITLIEAEQKANDAWLKGVQLGRDSTPVPAPGGAANDNSKERISDAG